MDYEKKNFTFAEKIGFLAGYFIFTTILFSILKFTDKLPSSWNYFSIALITASIVLIGGLIKRYYHGKS